jgi:hypothetical protein
MSAGRVLAAVLALPFGPPSGPATGHQVAVSLSAMAASLIHEEITTTLRACSPVGGRRASACDDA